MDLWLVWGIYKIVGVQRLIRLIVWTSRIIIPNQTQLPLTAETITESWLIIVALTLITRLKWLTKVHYQRTIRSFLQNCWGHLEAMRQLFGRKSAPAPRGQVGWPGVLAVGTWGETIRGSETNWKGHNWTKEVKWQTRRKLDGVGPVDNRPSTD